MTKTTTTTTTVTNDDDDDDDDGAAYDDGDANGDDERAAHTDNAGGLTSAGWGRTERPKSGCTEKAEVSQVVMVSGAVFFSTV